MIDTLLLDREACARAGIAPGVLFCEETINRPLQVPDGPDPGQGA